jgi:uncharacterized repeat protein (TIGR01451 family)
MAFTKVGAVFFFAGMLLLGACVEDGEPIQGLDLRLSNTDGGGAVSAGGTISYTLGYSNVGTIDATGVVLTETVPSNTTFNPGASTAGWARVPDNSAGSSCTLSLGALNMGITGSSFFAVTVDNPLPAGVTQVSNTATIANDGANAEVTPSDNTATRITPIM